MPTLFDMLSQSQNGQGMDLLARQFNLSQQQAALAVEALMPAFSQGLKQNTSDPYGVANFMGALASGQHAKYFENAQSAFSAQGVQDGNGILGHLFGSKDLSRAVAEQASGATGIGQDILKQMMPVIASMIMGGLFKQSAGQMPQANSAFGSGNPLTDILEQMMKQGGGLTGGQSQRQTPGSGGAMDNPFGKILEGMFGGASKAEPQAQPQTAPGSNPFGDNPFGKIFEEMLGGGRDAAPKEPAPPNTHPKAGAKPKNPYDDIFGKMFETGAKQRDDYQKGVESIFDQFKRGMDKRG